MGRAQLALGRVLKYEIRGLNTLEGWVAGRDGVKTQEVWVLAWMLAKPISKTLKGHLRLWRKMPRKKPGKLNMINGICSDMEAVDEFSNENQKEGVGNVTVDSRPNCSGFGPQTVELEC